VGGLCRGGSSLLVRLLRPCALKLTAKRPACSPCRLSSRLGDSGRVKRRDAGGRFDIVLSLVQLRAASRRCSLSRITPASSVATDASRDQKESCS
jgi:hypothetical protein